MLSGVEALTFTSTEKGTVLYSDGNSVPVASCGRFFVSLKL